MPVSASSKIGAPRLRVIPRSALWLLFAAMQVQSVRFTYLRYFVPQLRDSFFDGILHDDRLAPHSGRITVKELASTPTNAALRVNLVSIAARCPVRRWSSEN